MGLSSTRSNVSRWGDCIRCREHHPESRYIVTSVSGEDRLVSERERPLVVCLLPARNAAQDLPGYLESVARCCDAVVALDDGSTDETWEILNRHPIVKVVLRNPRREDYRDWDDAANRNRLLAAAAELDPQWLLSLDADERLDARDAISLRRFLETDALPGCAYGFRHVPMRNDGEHFLPTYQWIYRLFSAAPDQRFPSQKLHFIPIPTSIPRHRWIKTTLRIQHLGELTAQHRLSRFHKYLIADPLRTYQADYAQHLASGPSDDDLRRWQPRPECVPVLMGSNADDTGDDTREANGAAPPSLSAIIFAQNDENTIARTVASVVHQEVVEPFEVIMVASGNDRTARIVRERFPTVTVVELSKPALPGEARNAGLAVARGRFVAFPESNVELLPGNLAARLRAHRRGYAMVTGLVTNGTPTPAGWAAYFLDHAEKLPGHAPAEFNGAPGRCSYARLPLLEVGGFPEGVRTGEDTAVNRALVRRGYVAVRDPDVQLIHYNRCATPPRLLRHHFRRGRGWGRMVVAEYHTHQPPMNASGNASMTAQVPVNIRKPRVASRRDPEVRACHDHSVCRSSSKGKANRSALHRQIDSNRSAVASLQRSIRPQTIRLGTKKVSQSVTNVDPNRRMTHSCRGYRLQMPPD